MQLRGENPMIGASGLVGCFGGKVENETPGQAISREINEETDLVTTEADFTPVGIVEVVSDHRMEPIKVHASVFTMSIRKDQVFKANEGTTVALPSSKISEQLHKMTPGTRAAFEKFILGEK